MVETGDIQEAPGTMEPEGGGTESAERRAGRGESSAGRAEDMQEGVRAPATGVEPGRLIDTAPPETGTEPAD